MHVENEEVIEKTRWFKSGRVDFASTSKIDAEAGILYGVIMCQVGEAKGHGLHLEQEFIEAGIAYAQKHHAKLGMKARFGHPGMSNETLGTEMGRFKNFRVDGDKMVADLHLFESANLSPTNPGMRDWMLSMAQEDPQAIMCSIVFSIAQFYQRSKKGEKYTIKRVSDGWESWWESEDKQHQYDPKGKIYVSLKELMFCDIVDEGAATDRLFSAQFNSDKFSVIATEFLNEYPQIDSFIQENPEKLISFLAQRFNINMKQEKAGLIDQIIAVFKPKVSNSIQFYMSKTQLGNLSVLADKMRESTATQEDFAAATRELQEQGVRVIVMGEAQHGVLLSSVSKAEAAGLAVLQVVSPEAKPEELASTDLSAVVKAALAAKDAEIAELKKQLAAAEDPELPKKADPEKELGEGDPAPEHPATRQLREMRAKLGMS
jgi:hypothetical protein